MNKEIHNLLKVKNDETTIFTNKELKMIDDYIKELEAYKYNMDRDYLRLEKENKLLNEKIDKAIELNKQLIKDTKDFYRPTSDIIYSGDTLIDIAEQNLEILKEVE